MNHSPDSLERALIALASRADTDQHVDRVSAIHRRARRTTTVRVAVVLTTAAALVAVIAVALGTGGAPFTRGEDSVPAHRQAPPALTVRLSKDERATADLATRPARPGVPVVVLVRLRGLVPQPVDAAGEPPSTATDNLLGFRMHWSPDGFDANNNTVYRCKPGAKLVAIDTEFLMTTYYTKAGTYPITFETAACSPIGAVTQTLNLVVVAQP